MKKLMRSESDKKLAGVCGGLGKYFDIDSTIIRIVFVFIALFTGGFGGILLYIIAAILIPSDDKKYVTTDGNITEQESLNEAPKEDEIVDDNKEITVEPNEAEGEINQ